MSRIVCLTGSPAEAGREYGELVAPFLRQRIERMRALAKAGGGGREGLVERGRRLRGHLEGIAPEWVEEAEAMAAAAGVEADDLLALNALPSGFWDQESCGCTACLVVGAQSATGDTLVHKNRDEANAPQDFHVRRLGGTQILASRDVGNLGFAHFHSGRALAGGNNTGGWVSCDEVRECALSDCHLLRLVAERAGSCDQALAVLEDALAREAVGASGGCRGMIFLFGEPGKGVVVEMTSRRLACREVRDETLVRTNHFLLDEMQPVVSEPPNENTLRRYERAHELLDPIPEKNLADLARLARDRTAGDDSICNDKRRDACMTVSACIHVVRASTDDPLAHTRAAMGNPHNTLFIPVPRAIDGLPSPCVEGTMSDLARRVYARRGLGDHLAAAQAAHERGMAMEFAHVGAAARFGQPERLRAALTEFVARAVERVRGVLGGMAD